ncbi:uncharacterized protein ABDE67_011411 isoform 2-T2 [Symphorus nematophorus]
MSQEHTRDSSSVDVAVAGQRSTDDPMMSSSPLGSDQSQRKKVDNEARQQEVQDNDQLTSSNQDGAKASPEQAGLQMQVDVNQENQQMVPKNNQKVLQNLKKEMSKCLKYPADENILVDCIKQTSSDPENLLNFFKALNSKQEKGALSFEQPVAPQSHTEKSSSSWFSRGSVVFHKATVKVFSEVCDQTCGAHHVILAKVNKSIKMELVTHRQDCDIIVVFCPIISRVGSDVGAAMATNQDNKPVVLVLMHHTRDVDYSTDTKRWSETFQNIVLDVHVLFHETLGLLKCRRNDQAVQQIEKVLYRHSKYELTRRFQ